MGFSLVYHHSFLTSLLLCERKSKGTPTPVVIVLDRPHMRQGQLPRLVGLCSLKHRPVKVHCCKVSRSQYYLVLLRLVPEMDCCMSMCLSICPTVYLPACLLAYQVANQPGLEDVFADLLEYEERDATERGAEFYMSSIPEHLQGTAVFATSLFDRL